MTDLGTLALGAYDATNSTIDGVGGTPSGDPLEVIASADDNDYIHTDNNNSTDEVAYVALANMPGDFDSMDSVSINVRYHRDVDTDTSKTWDSIVVEIFADNAGTTSLAGPATIVSGNITTTTATNSGATTVDATPTGTKAQWDAAYVRFTFNKTKSMAGNTDDFRITAAEVTGTYTQAAGGDATANPTVITAAVTMHAPTVTTGSIADPTVITASPTIHTPTIKTGSIADPVVITTNPTIPTPVALTTMIANPTAITAGITMYAPTVKTGAVKSPPVITVPITLPTPAVDDNTAPPPEPGPNSATLIYADDFSENTTGQVETDSTSHVDASGLGWDTSNNGVVLTGGGTCQGGSNDRAVLHDTAGEPNVTLFTRCLVTKGASHVNRHVGLILRGTSNDGGASPTGLKIRFQGSTTDKDLYIDRPSGAGDADKIWDLSADMGAAIADGQWLDLRIQAIGDYVYPAIRLAGTAHFTKLDPYEIHASDKATHGAGVTTCDWHGVRAWETPGGLHSNFEIWSGVQEFPSYDSGRRAPLTTANAWNPLHAASDLFDLWWAGGPNFREQGYADTNDVSPWPSELPWGKDLTHATAGNRPHYDAVDTNLNSQPSVAFTRASSHHLQTAAWATAPDYTGGGISIVQVCYADLAPSDYRTFYDGIASGNRNGFAASGAKHKYLPSEGNPNNTAWGSDAAYLIRVHYTGAGGGNESSYINGALNTDTSRTDEELTGLTVGCYYNGTNAFEGTIALTMVVEGDVSAKSWWGDFQDWVTDHYGISLVRT
jgi:hypothetical protein